MKTETYKISKGQFLAQLEPFKSEGLPTNSIIHKQITGCGATTLELEFHRNSIIIEPNLPVIRGKADKMNKGKRKYKVVLAVWDKVSKDEIKQYIEDRKGYKKILTTPEGFDKVVEAIGESVFEEYFLLFDECEKVIQDVAYRSRIIDPLSLFFKFDNKALVSATLIIPSDPRFKNFTQVIVEPDYIYQHKIKVYPTNNIIFQLKKVIDSYTEFAEESDRKFFIFFKSTQRIKHIVQGLKLEDYSVYCSEQRVRELRSAGILNTHEQLQKTFSKYNFFTGRFFSAVDFDYKVYNCDPIIIMISDPLAIEHTVIDPATESIQIIGRFREPDLIDGEPGIQVVKDIYHISNYNSKLTSFSRDEIEAILNDIRKLHWPVSSFKASSNQEYMYRFITNILKVDGFAYFDRDGSSNHFMIDNFRDVEHVKGYYKTIDGLLKKYNKLDRFELHKTSQYQHYVLTDSDLREMTSHTALSKVNAFVSLRLIELMEKKMDSEYRVFNLEMLRVSYPKQMDVIDKYSLIKAADFDYDIDKIQQQQKRTSTHHSLKGMRAYAKQTFELKGYTSEQITTVLKTGVEVTGLKGYQANLPLLRKLAELSKRHKLDGVKDKGYTIIKFYD